MDSITQAALGGAVAYACWHRQLGRRALPWGLGMGTLPDLDIVLHPWLDPIQRLYWHRGESHAIWATLLIAALITPILTRLHRQPGPPTRPPRESLTYRTAFSGLWLILGSHVLIDVFTVYGTQLFAPFSRHGFGLNNLFIIDPLYTLPLLLGILLAATLRSPDARRRANVAGLAISTLYVVWSFVAQARAASVFAAELSRQGYVVESGRAQTSATPLNTVLWRHLAEVQDGFLVGYWSWLDPDTGVSFEFIPRNAAKLPPEVRDSRAFVSVDWFSQGFWAAFPAPDNSDAVHVADLRFSEMRPGAGLQPADWVWPFAWSFPTAVPPDRVPELVQVKVDFEARGIGFSDFLRRVRGVRSAW
jgi:inner membrane protein